jgi:hypothetical protein
MGIRDGGRMSCTKWGGYEAVTNKRAAASRMRDMLVLGELIGVSYY